MDIPKISLWGSVKAISTLAIVGVICVKAYQTPLTLTVDFPTLLSLLLAIFSVGLSALFYFKATETSNTFYDNTYKFTRDIAQLLAKMESGFGERLRHLDEGYSSMRSYLETRSSDHRGGGPEITKQKIEEEKVEVGKVMAQRNKIVRELLDRSQLQEKEKERFASQLKQKEEELEQMQSAMATLRKQHFMERLRRRRHTQGTGMDRFTKSQVIAKIGAERVLESDRGSLARAFERLSDDLPKGYIEDLEKHGYYDEGLTMAGVGYLMSLARSDDA